MAIMNIGGMIMYAIRSTKTNRWFSGINTRFGEGSSHHLIMDDTIPMLFKTKELARIELLSNHMHIRKYEILEVDLHIVTNKPIVANYNSMANTNG